MENTTIVIVNAEDAGIGGFKMSEDPFLKLIKDKENEKTKKYRDALLWAKSEARTEGSFDFIKSCEDFFNSKGYLTEKQMVALFAMDKNYYPESAKGYDD